MRLPDSFVTELAERLGDRLLDRLPDDLIALAQCALWAAWRCPAPGEAVRADDAAWLAECLRLLYPSPPSR